MTTNYSSFNEHEVLHELKHFLPAQAPLKDFIHHNTLHAFQKNKFYEGLHQASNIFGYRVSLSLHEYRNLFTSKVIREDILDKIILVKKGANNFHAWKNKMLHLDYGKPGLPRIGILRSHWKSQYKIDLDSRVHPILFRILCSYLDQGVALWYFPIRDKGFLTSVRELEKNSLISFFKTERVRQLLVHDNIQIADLLKILVSDESLYEHYLFDQQFAHQGWSGMVSSIESNPSTLLDQRNITLRDLIVLELLLEIDTLDLHFGEIWSPLGVRIEKKPELLFAHVPHTELLEVASMWQDAFEWTYYDQVLAAIQERPKRVVVFSKKSFQALFCIDDRECSFRRYVENIDPNFETFGTPGFFGVEFFFQPEHGKFYTKLCPAPVTPTYLIKESGTKERRETDVHFVKHSHSLFRGWLISQTLGFWSAIKLFLNIFRPMASPATASSFKHMDKFATLTIENKNNDRENGLQVGFKKEEMVQRVEGLLKSIGLVENFAPIVYVIGHGSSSVNNPHYAAYDCGACSGRAGSVNSRVICAMANDLEVRTLLKQHGIEIPDETQFIGGLHDTTRDEIVFFDEHSLSQQNRELHQQAEITFNKALDLNAKERSRRFISINTRKQPKKIHQEIRTRSVSLFEPRPELNHATNTLCIVGSRELSKDLFLDRRAFMNSYDYRIDKDGKYLFDILKAVAPVCGGINLEYYFSRVDNQKLGAGSKLPHNVMGLFGVANGIDGDLRPGLPNQMIEVHDPIRLLVIVEHYPSVVLETIQRSHKTYEWFINEWVHLVVVHPDTQQFYHFKEGAFSIYQTVIKKIGIISESELTTMIESTHGNIPIHIIS